MPKKSLKAAAESGATSIYDTLKNGNDVKDVQAVESAKDTETRGRKKKTDKKPQSRLNLKIDTELVTYLRAAAYRESSPEKTVSLTQYLCGLIREDMKKHAKD